MGIYDIAAARLDGTVQPLSDYRGKILLVVNVASNCGLTPQYAGLEALYQRFKDQGVVVLGFPSDQFFQEPGDAAQIADFCTRNYGVTFPLFAKVEVNGSQTHPLFAYLKAEQPGFLGIDTIKWNFTKFLVDWDGVVCHRYAPTDTPESIERDVAALLSERSAPAS